MHTASPDLDQVFITYALFLSASLVGLLLYRRWLDRTYTDQRP